MYLMRNWWVLSLLAGLSLLTSGSWNTFASKSETEGWGNNFSYARALESTAVGSEAAETAEKAQEKAEGAVDTQVKESEYASEKAAAACTANWPPEHTKWPRGTVYYGFGSSANAALRRVVRTYMDKIEETTKQCIQFKGLSKQNSTKNFLWIFYQKNDTIGTLGMKTGNQSLPLGERHSHPLANHVTRQLLRTIGLNYEHNRPDRDNYVTILTKSKDKRLFGKDCKFNTYGLPYDFQSIMHFHEREDGGRSEASKIVIKAKSGKGPVPKVGAQELSEKDVEKILKMYNC